MANKLIIKGLNSAYEEPLRSVLFNSFYLQPTVNDSYQLQFTAYDDKSVAFNLLTVEASVIWDNQEFVIKQIAPDYSGGVTTIQVTATHIGYDIERIFQRNVKSGTASYTVDDVLSFYLKGNELGYTWQVIGTFDKQQITDLGNGTGKDMLSKIVEAWPKAIFWPDNKNIRIYQHDSIAKNLGNRIDYLNNTKEVKLTYDSTGIINKLQCVSGDKSDDSDSSSDDSDDKPKDSGKWFTDFFITDDASIKQFGVHDGGDVSDDRFHDAKAMETYARTKLVPDPTLTIETTKNGNDQPTIEEVVRLEVRPLGYVTTVEVVSYTYYPLDKSQPTQVTLNNQARTILNYKQATQDALSKSVVVQKSAIAKATTEAADALKYRLSGTKVVSSGDAMPLFTMKVAEDNDEFGLNSGDSFAVQTTADGVIGLDEKIKEGQVSYPAATPTTDGLMTSEDKAKLDALGNDDPTEMIQMKDGITGDLYQLTIENGQIKITKGR